MNKRNVRKLVNQTARELNKMLGCDEYDLDEIRWALHDMFFDGYNQACREMLKKLDKKKVKHG
jgi:hypothetical protein